MVGLLALLLTLSGCVPYPDGLVARRAEGFVVRSQCPPGSAPQVTGVEVWSLGESEEDPYETTTTKVTRMSTPVES